MIHHAMWIWTQAVLLCAAFDADSKSDGSTYLVDSYTVVSKCFSPQHKVSCHLVQLCVVKYGMAVTCWP